MIGDVGGIEYFGFYLVVKVYVDDGIDFEVVVVVVLLLVEVVVVVGVG